MQFKTICGATMKCPSCGYPEMEKMTIDETLTYGRTSVVLHDMNGCFCPECDEGVWDAESYDRYTQEQSRLLGACRTTREAHYDSAPHDNELPGEIEQFGQNEP